jgi:hypothetical protein
VKTIGLIVNPVAGMGGRVGLKGTDGVVDEAVKRGAVPVAPEKATLMLRALREARDVYGAKFQLKWKTAGGHMGEVELLDAGWALGEFEVVYRPPENSSSADTRAACEVLMGLNTDLILFCGGDGTARDTETWRAILFWASRGRQDAPRLRREPVIVSDIQETDDRLGTASWRYGLDEDCTARPVAGQARLCRTPHEPN